MRPVRIYDTLSREVRRFQPRTPPRVGLFVCGLTPYDEAHIGHGRVAVVFDVVARALTHWGYRVFYVQNVTNIDDKLLRRAAGLGAEPLGLAEEHFRSWARSMDRLRVRSVNYYPRATDYIPEIIDQVRALVDRGFAYVADDGSVYYEVGRFPDYGKLSGQRVEALRPGARLEVDRRKRSAEDFVLWKAATPGEPSWPSPWGPGRPGWHIEDTAITGRLLGPQYDLHGGGLDLKFPHHEAEIAQSEGATGLAPMVAFWMHSGLLTLRGEKMSKSLGNVRSLASTIDSEGGEVLRFYYLNAHYRNPLDFDPATSFTEAREAYRRLREPFDRLTERSRSTGPGGTTELPDELADAADELEDRLDELLADDFRTREPIAELFGWGRRVVEWLDRTPDPSPSACETLLLPYRWGEEVLGLFPAPDREAGDRTLDRVVAAALAARARARQRGDFAEADRIRTELLAAGILVEDRGGSSTWRYRPADGATEASTTTD